MRTLKLVRSFFQNERTILNLIQPPFTEGSKKGLFSYLGSALSYEKSLHVIGEAFIRVPQLPQIPSIQPSLQFLYHERRFTDDPVHWCA